MCTPHVTASHDPLSIQQLDEELKERQVTLQHQGRTWMQYLQHPGRNVHVEPTLLLTNLMYSRSDTRMRVYAGWLDRSGKSVQVIVKVCNAYARHCAAVCGFSGMMCPFVQLLRPKCTCNCSSCLYNSLVNRFGKLCYYAQEALPAGGACLIHTLLVPMQAYTLSPEALLADDLSSVMREICLASVLLSGHSVLAEDAVVLPHMVQHPDGRRAEWIGPSLQATPMRWLQGGSKLAIEDFMVCLVTRPSCAFSTTGVDHFLV